LNLDGNSTPNTKRQTPNATKRYQTPNAKQQTTNNKQQTTNNKRFECKILNNISFQFEAQKTS
jgi:hypothetical protein